MSLQTAVSARAWRARAAQGPSHITHHHTLITAARPGRRWDGDNGPEQSDFVAVRNLLAATPRGVKRFVLTTSAGVERQGQFPFFILNLFGAPSGLRVPPAACARVCRRWSAASPHPMGVRAAHLRTGCTGCTGRSGAVPGGLEAG